MLCVDSILKGNALVDDSLWSVYWVVSHWHRVRCRLAPVLTDCVCSNFSVNLITGENYIVRSLNDIYSSHSTVWVIKLRIMRWAGNVACMGIGQMYTGFCWGNLREVDYLEDLDVDGRIILSGFQEIVWEAIDWNFLAQDRDKLFQKDCAVWS